MGALRYMGVVVLVLVCAVWAHANATHMKRNQLDTFLKRLLKDDEQQQVRSSGPRKQLIVTRFPGGETTTKYYAGQLGPDWCDKMNYFLFTYAMAAKKIGDEFMIFYNKDMDRSCFDPALFACSNAYILPMPAGCEMDLWMRDFTTINWDDPIHFKYEPVYLQGDGHMVEQDFLEAMSHFNLLANPTSDTSQNLIRQNTVLALDGGNVVDCADKAIVSLRVEEENLGLTRLQIRRLIEQALPGKDICFIRNPPFEEDTSGHADGVVSFLDKDTIILLDYGDEEDFNLRWDQIRTCYPESKYRDLRIIRMENYLDKREIRKESKSQRLLNVLRQLISTDADHQRSKRKVVDRFTSATGSTINLLASDLGLYVPSFVSVKKNNDKQYNLIDANKGNKKIERVDTGEVSFMGGSVRCMSWQMYADMEVALRLMDEATQPKNSHVPGVNCDLPVDQLFEQLK